MKKGLQYLCIGIVVLCVVFLASIPLVNDATARQAAKRLEEIPLPEGTTAAETVYGANKYVGNGNGMQYFACLLVESDLSIEELRQYYAAYDCEVQAQQGQQIAQLEHHSLSFQTPVTARHFIVYTWASGNLLYAQLDIRGH